MSTLHVQCPAIGWFGEVPSTRLRFQDFGFGADMFPQVTADVPVDVRDAMAMVGEVNRAGSARSCYRFMCNVIFKTLHVRAQKSRRERESNVSAENPIVIRSGACVRRPPGAHATTRNRDPGCRQDIMAQSPKPEHDIQHSGRGWHA